MRCSSSAASSGLPSLRASLALAVSSRIAVRMSLTLCVSPVLMRLPFVVDWLLCTRVRALCTRKVSNAKRLRSPPRDLATASRCSLLLPLEELAAQPDDGVVLTVGDAFLHRDQRIIGDLDVLGADFGAALGDVAVAEAEL